jgi:hypothetical protein
MEVKFTNPFAKKRQELKEAAAATCEGCGSILPDMPGEDTIRRWCSRPKKAECRKLYRAKTRMRTAARYA